MLFATVRSIGVRHPQSLPSQVQLQLPPPECASVVYRRVRTAETALRRIHFRLHSRRIRLWYGINPATDLASVPPGSTVPPLVEAVHAWPEDFYFAPAQFARVDRKGLPM